MITLYFLLVQEEDPLLAQEDLLLAQEEDKEREPEKLKMVEKTVFPQNCPGTFGVSFAIITGAQEQV